MQDAGMPVLDVREHALANGMRVYLLPDDSAPVFTFQVWYQVGSGDEWEARPGEDHGITGLSHFFEHLMFRGTEKYPEFFDHVYQRGGQLNAWTWLDATCYWEKLPRDHLEFAIDAEADRLEHMKLDFLNLEPEREVVKSERLLRTDNDPSGAVSEALHRLAYREHPYGWPTVGWMRDLNCITIEEAEAYYSPRYAPNNAFIILVGDVDPDHALGLIEDRFGKLPAREDLPPRSRTPEPVQTEVRRGRVVKPVAAPMFEVAWQAPPAANPDFAALEVLHYLLVRGKSSRIQRALVHGDDPVATRATGSLWPMVDPYLYLWEVTARPGRSAREAEARLLAEIRRLARDPPTPREMEKAVNGLSADVVRATLSCQGRADNLGFSVLTTGDPLTFMKRLTLYPAVTAADVSDAAAKWLSTGRRTVIAATDPDGPVALAKAHAGAEPAAGWSTLIEAIEHRIGRAQVADREAELDVEATAIERLESRRIAALERARADGDETLATALEAFGEEDDKGPRKRGLLLETGRTENAEARLRTERTGEELRARVAASVAGNAAVAAASAAYLGTAAPSALGEALDSAASPSERAVLQLLLGHISDLSEDPAAAQRAYQAVREADADNGAADLAWERLSDG